MQGEQQEHKVKRNTRSVGLLIECLRRIQHKAYVVLNLRNGDFDNGEEHRVEINLIVRDSQ